MRYRILLGAIFLVAIVGNAYGHHVDAKIAIETRKAVNQWWSPCGTECEWEWLYAQFIQESSLNPNAVSPVGAEGVGQWLPSSWQEAIRRGWAAKGSSPFQLRPAIVASARYMEYFAGQWRSERPDLDRKALSRASYNAGLGSLLKAQKACDMASLYDDIIVCLPEITGRHAQETIGYEIAIRRYYRGL